LTVNREQSTIAGMSRGPRQTPGGIVYHVLNRAVARRPLFEKPADYAAFLRVLAEALRRPFGRRWRFTITSRRTSFTRDIFTASANNACGAWIFSRDGLLAFDLRQEGK